MNICITFIITYHPHLKHLGKLIQNNMQHLYADVKVRTAFTPATFASFRTACNLKSYLLRSKLYPLERKTGLWKCKFQHFLVYKNVRKCDIFSSFVNKESFKINHHFDYNSKCMIYLMLSKVCGKQYVGSIAERFRFR